MYKCTIILISSLFYIYIYQDTKREAVKIINSDLEKANTIIEQYISDMFRIGNTLSIDSQLVTSIDKFDDADLSNNEDIIEYVKAKKVLLIISIF